MGHLPPSTTINDYQLIILNIINNQQAKLYVYDYNGIIYPTIVSMYESSLWLVMFSMDGIMETAFLPDDPVAYLSKSAFKYMGLLKEL